MTSPGDGLGDGPGDAHHAGGGDDRPDLNRPEANRPDLDGPELDIDAAFAALVAQFRTAEAGEPPWPAAEDLPEDLGENRPAEDRPAENRPAAADPPRDIGGPAVFPVVNASEPVTPMLPVPPLAAQTPGSEDADPAYLHALDEHYEPPEPPPLPRGDTVSRFAWAGVIGGPLFLLIAALISADLPGPVLLCALGAFIGGFVTLVARMPGERSDDGDDGAVV